MIRRNILKNFIKYQTRIYPKPMFFSEVVKKEEENIVVLKNEDLEKIIKKYNVPILKDYKEIKIQETDFEVMNIQKNATVRQIYTAYIHNQKILNLVDVTNREEKLKRLDDAYHKLIMNKIKISSNLQKAEQIGKEINIFHFQILMNY